jgi:H(+)-transporting ATP synthase subunit D
MSSSGQREAVFPTRMTLNVTKGRLKGAQTGHSLLKRKADALTKRFRTITSKIDEAKRKMGKVMQVASFSLAEVQYVAGDIGYSVQESVKSASYKVQAKQENVSGKRPFEGKRYGDRMKMSDLHYHCLFQVYCSQHSKRNHHKAAQEVSTIASQFC